MLSTWHGFCRWLRAQGQLVDDPTEDIEGPGRPDWKAKPLELVELSWVIAAAYSPDERGSSSLAGVGRGAGGRLRRRGVRVGKAIALRVNDLEARDRSPRPRVYGKGGPRRVVPVGPEVVEADLLEICDR